MKLNSFIAPVMAISLLGSSAFASRSIEPDGRCMEVNRKMGFYIVCTEAENQMYQASQALENKVDEGLLARFSLNERLKNDGAAVEQMATRALAFLDTHKGLFVAGAALGYARVLKKAAAREIKQIPEYIYEVSQYKDITKETPQLLYRTVATPKAHRLLRASKIFVAVGVLMVADDLIVGHYTKNGKGIVSNLLDIPLGFISEAKAATVTDYLLTPQGFEEFLEMSESQAKAMMVMEPRLADIAIAINKYIPEN